MYAVLSKSLELLRTFYVMHTTSGSEVDSELRNNYGGWGLGNHFLHPLLSHDCSNSSGENLCVAHVRALDLKASSSSFCNDKAE